MTIIRDAFGAFLTINLGTCPTDGQEVARNVGMRRLLVLAANAAIVLFAITASSATIKVGETVAVIGNPFAGQTAVYSLIAAAGGAIVAPGRFSFTALANSSDQTFPRRLRAAGALLVIDASFAKQCGLISSGDR